MSRFSCSIAVAALVTASILPGQSAAPLKQGDRFISVNAGSSFHSTSGPHIALVRDRRVLTSGIQVERVFRSGRLLAFSSTAELVPLAIVIPNRNAPSAECWVRTSSRRRECYAVDRPHSPVAGVGVTPLGLRIYVGPRLPVRVFAGLAAGAIAFDRKTPVIAARAVNFAAEYVLGTELVANGGRSALVASWKFQHWSNANTASFNPGLDANLLYIGIKTKRR